MRTSDLLITATGSLRRNKGRSLLTILGIVIGIAAVILMLAVGRSAEGLILNQVADLGSDLIFIEPSSGDPKSGPPDPFVDQSLTLDDEEALEASRFFSEVAPVLISTLTVTYSDVSDFYAINGVDEDYSQVFSAELDYGRDIETVDVETRARVAVLGREVVEDLFGDQDPIGKKIDVRGTKLTVIGVYPELGSRFFQNLDAQINIPVTTAQQIIGKDPVTYMALRAVGDVEIAKEEARFILRDEHDIDNPEGDLEKDDFFVGSQSDAEETVGVIGDVLTVLLASIAAISLVVGGIGIMNIMLVSVTERTREIGLRKAVGATYDEILQQFLTEAILLTFIGGIAGIVIGVMLAYLSAIIAGRFIEGWDPIIPPIAIILGLSVSMVVGIVFGLYPARKAAKLNPIDALRYE